MTAHVNGIDLFYEKTGEGRPLLLIHGNGEDHTIFDEAVEVLKDRFTCYCTDSRGHGQSTTVDVLHYEDMADDMIALLEELDLRDVAVYGFSDGGILGLLIASRCDRVTTLITSGANLTPKGVIPRLRLLIKITNFFKRDPKLELMIKEPHISAETLGKIRARTLIMAGSGDVVAESETR
ncbi:MAG: alpha/beta hydrolase, partial [Firmicutes bacterium]|nr:alpha/beta hydrolase [Bacillota bacterium]